MLSTGNQHKSNLKIESVRSSSIVSKAANRFSLRKIPKHTYSLMSMSIVFAMHTALVGCGAGNDPTTRTRTPTPPASTARTSYNLTVQSPVLLKNVKVILTDTATGTIIGQSIIQNGNQTVFTVPVAYIKSNNIILITLAPIDSSSKYFDPMLNHSLGALTSFNKTLHALVSLTTSDATTKIDPFSEISYERALIRAGMLDIDHPRLNALTITHLTTASAEMTMSMGTTSTIPFSLFFNSPQIIAALNIYAKSGSLNVLDIPASNTLTALSQLALFAQNNPSDQTPYLSFAKRAALDLLDGDLDGLTIFGGDTAGTVQIADPILYSGVTSALNNDPDHTDLASLINTNKDQRNNRGLALKAAINQYFENINASLPLASRTDTASLNYIQHFDYGIFVLPYSGVESGLTDPTTRIGAGNYTRAFGLPTGTDLRTALDANDTSSRTNDIMQLNGTYLGSNGCKLSIDYDGVIQLSQGNKIYESVVSRKFSDSLIRISDNHYLLNVTSADLTAPRFIQIKTIGAQILSADAGRSSQQVPMTLDTTDLSCTF